MGAVEDQVATIGVKQLVKNIFADELKQYIGIGPEAVKHVDTKEIMKRVNSRIMSEVTVLAQEAVDEMTAAMDEVLKVKK